MLSMMMAKKMGIQLGWNQVAVSGFHKARMAPIKTQRGKAFARDANIFSILDNISYLTRSQLRKRVVVKIFKNYFWTLNLKTQKKIFKA